MDELVNLVVKKTGLPAATAKQAVETVIAYLKDKLPPAIGGQLDGVLGGGGTAGIAQSLGGLLGKKK